MRIIKKKSAHSALIFHLNFFICCFRIFEYLNIFGRKTKHSERMKNCSLHAQKCQKTVFKKKPLTDLTHTDFIPQREMHKY